MLGALPCSSNADCPISGGRAGVCGGRRCVGGANYGVACSNNSECPDSRCLVPGAVTAPNECDDRICTATADGGVCAAGPVDGRCTLQPFRPCAVNADCPAPGDSCRRGIPRPCIPDPLTLRGVADPAMPVVVGALCLPGTSATSVNLSIGLPGPATFTLPAEVQFQR